MQRPVHFEIYTSDPEAVQPFYQDVFGWTFKKFEGGPIEYWLVTTGADDQPGITEAFFVPAKAKVPAPSTRSQFRRWMRQSRKSNEAEEAFACRRWRFPKSVGWPTRKIQPGNVFGLMEPDTQAQ